MDLLRSVPLFALRRGPIREVVVHGAVAMGRGRTMFSTAPDAVVIARSLLKPWQFLNCGILADQLPWLMAIASHSGQPEHVAALGELSAFTGVDIDGLQCPRAWPMDAAEAERLRAEGASQSKRYHPCAGKHLAHMVASRRDGLHTDYLAPAHPLQQRLVASLDEHLRDAHQWVTDSCGLPTLACTMADHVRLWQELASATHEPARRLREMWRSNATLVGGRGRLDTLLTQASRSYVLAKEGADGLLAVQSLAREDDRNTVMIKLAHGYNASHLGLALLSLLRQHADLFSEGFLELRLALEDASVSWVPAGQTFEPLSLAF